MPIQGGSTFQALMQQAAAAMAGAVSPQIADSYDGHSDALGADGGFAMRAAQQQAQQQQAQQQKQAQQQQQAQQQGMYAAPTEYSSGAQLPQRQLSGPASWATVAAGGRAPLLQQVGSSGAPASPLASGGIPFAAYFPPAP
jgi:hypothetical protein